jgi:hypothetical protein
VTFKMLLGEPQTSEVLRITRASGKRLAGSMQRRSDDAVERSLQKESARGVSRQPAIGKGIARMTSVSATIHLVDDDASFRTSIARLLCACGYAVETYASVDEFASFLRTVY